MMPPRLARCFVALGAVLSAEDVLGPHVIAELYSLSQQENLTADREEQLAALSVTSTSSNTPLTMLTQHSLEEPEKLISCGFRYTSNCDVANLFASGEVATGDLLLLGWQDQSAGDELCGDSVTFSAYSMGGVILGNGAQFDGHVWVDLPKDLSSNRVYRLCQQTLANQEVTDRGLVKFTDEPETVVCAHADTTERAKFLSIFQGLRCRISSVSATDDGFYYTVLNKYNCSDVEHAMARNLICNQLVESKRCTLTLAKFDEPLRLCRCSAQLRNASGELDAPLDPQCDSSLVVDIALLQPPSDQGDLESSSAARRVLQGSMIIDGSSQLSKNLTGSGTSSLISGRCTSDADCGTYGRCVKNACTGFFADSEDTKLIRCVEGYRCDVSGEIAGLNIDTNFQVIGVSPGEICGTAEPLPAKLSIFSNPNRWRCAGRDSSFCQFSPGVGQRRNKTIALEGLRLCGCPNADLDGNSIACDTAADFYVPLAKLGVQECLTNAHCLHKTFAYCVNDHCAGFMGIAASAGMKAYQCLLNKSCSVQSIAAKTINEGLKIVPVAASFNCGAEQALDPEFYEEHSLPCVMDINGDGHCDIHLGVPRALGTNRLCGCNGSDRGGNGRACDQPEDFDVDLGLLTVDECNMDTDCSGAGFCVANKCLIDSQAPYAIAIRPANGTETVPPVTDIRITFSESIRFSTTQTDRRVVIMSPETKYELQIADPTLHSSSSDAHRIKIEGRDLVITPDLRINSLPEGEYVLGFEGGVVEDLQGNGNIGSTDFVFSVTSDGGCPFLGVTGFGINSSLNINGIYRSTGILNGKPKWTSILPTIDGLNDNSQIFWYSGSAQTTGRWVIGLSHDHSKFLSYLDIAFPSGSRESHSDQSALSPMRPSSGSWKKWSQGQWIDQRNIVVECIKNRVTTPPRFIDSTPLPGAVGVSPSRFEMTFTFDRPVTYGHWSQITLTAAEPASHEIVIDPEDEILVRNKILFRNLLGNQMHIRLGDEHELLPGTEYQVSVDTGAFTDLQYNPVAPIVKGDFKFTTYGRSCGPYSIGLYDHLKIDYMTEADHLNSQKWPHNSEAEIYCAPNYSPRFRPSELLRNSGRIHFGVELDDGSSSTTTADVTCIDGEWDSIGMNCMAMCAPYQTMGNQYVVDIVKLASDDNDLQPFGHAQAIVQNITSFKSGSQLKISCATNSETLTGSSLGEVTSCVNGRWSATSLKCGVTCPPFPDLGRAYTVAELRSSGTESFAIGSSRTVSCNADALGDRGQTETIVCQEDGSWQSINLSCYYNCAPLDLAGLSQSFGLEPATGSLSLAKSSKGQAGETHIFRCEDNTLAQVETEEIDELPQDIESPLTAYWAEIDKAFPVTSERQVQISCVEGQWHRRKQLNCLRSCDTFVTPGPGYNAKLILGTGIEPGSTYELSCKSDAIEERRNGVQGSDQIICLRGEWVRTSKRVECASACVHPVTYFGSNYRVIDPDSGLALTSVPSHASSATSYRHHSQTFTIECARGMQPLDAPLVADPSLNYLRGKSPSDPDAPVRLAEVVPMTGLFESPAQSVRCNDGEWLPFSSNASGARLVRCSPYCPSFNSIYSKRYAREDTNVGFSWGSRRQFSCAENLVGGHFGRLTNGTLVFTSRSSVALICGRGAWLAPSPPFEIPELLLTYTPLLDRLIVKTAHSSPESVQQAMTAALPCGRSCSKSSLENIIRQFRLRIVSPSRNSLTTKLNHGTLIDIWCDVGTSRISGPAESDSVGCSDGDWTMPLVVCGVPSCHDGAVNQDEENVDCGGSNCVAACPQTLHSCESGHGTCSSCMALPDTDKLFTAENSIAGPTGSFITSTNLPLAHGALLHTHHREYFNLPTSAISDVLYVPYLCINGSWEKLQVTHKRLLEEANQSTEAALLLHEDVTDTTGDVGSSIHTDVASGDESQSFKQLTGLSELVLQAASCNDGVQSRGEWGIDCGGVCSAPCPDCFDHVMNGQEIWVDCGGSCRACSTCAMADLKAYDTEAYTMRESVVSMDTGVVTESANVASTQRPAHGRGVRISCSSNAVAAGGSLPLDLVCLDGRFWPVSLAHEMTQGESDISPADFTALPLYAVRCELKGIHELEKSVLHKFKSPGMTLDFCESRSNSATDGSAVSSFCCPLLKSYNKEMGDECGALLYSGGVSGFCRGVCYQRLRQLTEFYDTLKEETVAKASQDWDNMSDQDQKQLQVCEQVSDYLKTISKSFCYTNSEGSGSAGSSEYCFASAGTNLNQLRTLDLYTKSSDITLACKKNSCFANNVQYVDTMWQLIHLKEMQLADSLASRRLLAVAQNTDIEANDTTILFDEKAFPYIEHLQAIDALPEPSGLMSSLIDTLLSITDDVIQGDPNAFESAPLEEDWKRWLERTDQSARRLEQCPSHRKLGGSLSVAPVFGSIFRDPASVQYSDTVVPLMCLKDSAGEPCTKQFQQIIHTLTLWGGQTAMTSANRVSLGQAVANLAATCNESSCYLQLSRHLGQEVSERGIERGDPYQRFMGLFLKLFGRYFCQTDAQGGSCAVKYLGWLIQGMQPPAARANGPTIGTEGSVNSDLTRVVDKTAEIRALTPNCDVSKCSANYINDGICDPQCFNVNCGFDGGDCLVQSMFPGIVQRLMSPIPLAAACHPLNSKLESCPKDFSCHKQISGALVNYGCCFAVGIDMLKEVLDLEYYSHPIIRQDSPSFQTAAEYIDVEALRQLLLEQFGEISTVSPKGIMQQPLSNTNFALDNYQFYSPDRSSLYSQTLCNLYQDRTCSRSMSRRVLSIQFQTESSQSFDALAWMLIRRPSSNLKLLEFPYDSVNYDEFRAAVEREVPVLRLKVLLRKQLSDILVLPTTDIREVDIWPVQDGSGNQALVEIVVDPSLFVDETRNTLQTMLTSGEFQELISATVAQWRKGNSDILEHFLTVMDGRNVRRLDVAAEVDQNKAMSINVASVRQMPVTNIKNVQFKILTLDPVTTGSDGQPVDSLQASESTFGLGTLTGMQRKCSVRTLISDQDPWGTVSLPFSNYLVTSVSHGGAVSGENGEIISISCKGPTFAAKAGSPERQEVLCVNGRWISATREALLECIKPCPHFHLQTATPDVYRVVGDGNSAGSTRRVSCSTGYSSSSSAASELLTCSDGVWSALSLQCKRTTVFDGKCAGVPLDFFVNNFHYKMTTQTDGSGSEISMPNSVWWKAICQRGYELSTGTEPLYFVCMDDQRLLSFGLMSYHLQQKVLKPPSAEGLESALRQFVSDVVPTGQMAEVDLARLMWSTQLPLKASTTGITLNSEVTTLVCTETIITKPALLVESGIDDWVYIGVVGSIAIGATILFGLWGYYWQTRGRKRRNIRKAKKLAAAAELDTGGEALLAEPTAAEVAPKYPSTEASELFPSTKLPHVIAQAPPQRPGMMSQRLLKREDHSSNGYYSDVEYYAKHQPD